jgi:alkanesulfonate monooxygenase SsuD/methylene tetrahydromethanopterin reductase-like flavin-dependent oxidoreductase (luciferase family)
MVEHHNLVRHRERGAAVALAHVAAGTNTIQIGPGGIKLPQHPLLSMAEQFGTLAALAYARNTQSLRLAVALLRNPGPYRHRPGSRRA